MIYTPLKAIIRIIERLNLSEAKFVSLDFKGATITARKIEPHRPIPGTTAEHEAIHVVAAGEIVFATIIPSGNALGTAQPVRMTAASAAAPEAMGYDGTGWDMFVVKHILGVNPETAKAAARLALRGKEKEVKEVATLLQERGTIGQPDVREARQTVRKRSMGIFPAEVTIKNPDGETQIYSTETFYGEVDISNLHGIIFQSSEVIN